MLKLESFFSFHYKSHYISCIAFTHFTQTIQKNSFSMLLSLYRIIVQIVLKQHYQNDLKVLSYLHGDALHNSTCCLHCSIFPLQSQFDGSVALLWLSIKQDLTLLRLPLPQLAEH